MKVLSMVINGNILSTISASRIKQDLINKIQNLDDATIDVAIKLYVKGIRVNKNHSMDVLIGFRKDSSSTPLSNEEKEQISKHLDTMSNFGSPGTSSITYTKNILLLKFYTKTYRKRQLNAAFFPDIHLCKNL